MIEKKNPFFPHLFLGFDVFFIPLPPLRGQPTVLYQSRWQSTKELGNFTAG
jgi:hypothetical protein